MKNNKVQVGVAARKKTVKPLRFRHLTTSGFNGLQPLMYRPMIPDEKINGRATFKVRSDALVEPIMTGIRFLTHNFFVRYKDVWPAWDDFDNKTMHSYPNSSVATLPPSIPRQCPYITVGDFAKMFCTPNNGFVIEVNNDNDDIDSDITVQITTDLNSDPAFKRYRLTEVGFRAYKLLVSLGYKPIFDYSSTEPMELLTIMCYFKVFTDWYLKSSYSVSQTTYRYIVSAFQTDHPNVQATQSTTQNNYYAMLLNGLQWCVNTFYFDDDYYDAWDNPNGPNQGAVPLLQIPDIANDYPFPASSGSQTIIQSAGATTYANDNGTPSLTSTSSTSNPIQLPYRLNQYMLDSLKKLSDMVKRFQLVGVRAVDRFLARYGIQLQDTHRAMLLDSKEHQLIVGDVEANADSSNGQVASNVGDLAGKGVVLSDIPIRCNSGSHAGTFFVLLSTISDQSLAFGCDPFHFNVDSLQFYNPELDSLGTAVVPQGAIVNYGRANNNYADFFKRYGFMKQYYMYLVNRSIISGKFIVNTFGAQELSAWYTFRMVPDNTVVHSLDFLRSTQANSFLDNRIFYDNSNLDKFKVFFNASFTVNNVMTPLKHVYDFDERERVIDVTSNGSNVN